MQIGDKIIFRYFDGDYDGEVIDYLDVAHAIDKDHKMFLLDMPKFIRGHNGYDHRPTEYRGCFFVYPYDHRVEVLNNKTIEDML